ncbi:MAG: sigma-70 family RNA polymerase sigma factor [Bacteroidales bacterium]|nr:sigma-70 family RNA polymerase sigma factor [Bacteroidales bacterium]
MTIKEYNGFIDSESRKLYAFAYKMLKNQQESEDIVQNVLVKLWKKRDELDNINNLRTLALTMTKNECIDVLRRWRFSEKSDVDGVAQQEKSNSLSPLENMVSDETKNMMRQIISDLESPYKEIITMREIEGLPYEEIAGMTSLTVNNLRVIVSRARQMIKEEYLKKHGPYGK